MNLHSFVKRIFIELKTRELKKKITFVGSNYDKFLFATGSSVSLCDGSTNRDVVLGDKVWMWGQLCSQSGGKITFGNYSKIGNNSTILCCESVSVGAYTAIADNVHISDNNNHPVSPEYRKFMRINGDDESRLWKYSAHKPVVIGENCWIGRNVSIMKGVEIGDNCVIASNSVVTRSVPANCIAAGNPAKVVKTNIQEILPPSTCEGFNKYIKLKSQ